MADEMMVESLVGAVKANRKYAQIIPSLVTRLSRDAINKGLRGKAAVKEVRNKLHQVGGAYFTRRPDYSKPIETLNRLPNFIKSPDVKQFCRKQMSFHASTNERLPILEKFFQICLEPIGPVSSILDLAGGMNPLAIPWMPLAEDFTYTACDIYLDMLDFIQAFFIHFVINGVVLPCDLVSGPLQEAAQVAFLLKTIPCLEQVDKNISITLLNKIQAKHILVSFPAKSLGGSNKGMPDFYRAHFFDLIKDQSWQVREFSFPTEIAFLISK
jgi:16S rRNA (guanine(1405)-N(7))-methyltransferase